MPRLKVAVVDTYVSHTSVLGYAAAAAQDANMIAARRARWKRSDYRCGMAECAAMRFVPLAVEPCGRTIRMVLKIEY